MESRLQVRNKQRRNRKFRVRKALRGNAQKPRMSVFRSNKHLQVQLIDDENSTTLLSLGTLSKEFQGSDFARKSKEAAREIGKRIGQQAKQSNISWVVFDRGQYKYHGLIAELANAAREQGLMF